MASSHKTRNLLLNVWDGTDKPTRSDFVQDNQLIDAAIWLHTADRYLHLTDEEKTRVGNPYYTDVVQGTGTAQRTISFDFTPKLVIYFALDEPPVVTNNGVTTVNCCIAVNGIGGSGTCVIAAAGLVITHGTVGNLCYDLNSTAKQYAVVAFR
ncbi:MAG: hypothetical protein IIZ59_01510 [Clostridia bacterium]|nr:hypothetical protein [Clostridia bacterium]